MRKNAEKERKVLTNAIQRVYHTSQMILLGFLLRPFPFRFRAENLKTLEYMFTLMYRKPKKRITIYADISNVIDEINVFLTAPYGE